MWHISLKRMFKKLPETSYSFAVAIVFCLASLTLFGQDANAWSPNVSPLPAPTGMVNDFAGVIDQAAKQQLETRLRQFKEKTGVELAAVVVRTTGDREIFDYSLAVARGGRGSKAMIIESFIFVAALIENILQVSVDMRTSFRTACW